MGDIVISTNIDTFDVNSADDGISLGSKTVTLNTKDTYVPENIKVTVGASINVAAGSLNNGAAEGVEYSENTEDTTIIPSGGYLYINKGWFENTKISLGHLIPEIASNDAGVGHILTGYKAYDEAGNVLTGTVPTITPVFQGGAVSVTPSVNSLTVPTVTYNATGTFLPTGTGNVGSTYGVTTTAPSSGTDGTNYMTIDATHTASDGSVKAYATANRTAVTYKNAAVGYVNKAANTQALAEPTTAATGTSSASAIKPTVTDNFAKLYIPIVTVFGDGGGVSKVTSDSSLSITGTAPTVTLTYSGKFTDIGSSGVGATYGVIAGVPSSGTDGTNYLSIVTSASSNTQTLTGNATIKYTRAAVTYTNSAGAIAAHNDSTLLGASSPSTGLTQSGTRDVTASITGAKTYSIPIVSLANKGTGGAVTVSANIPQDSIQTTVPTVTVSKTGSMTTTGNDAWGVTTTKPNSWSDGASGVSITISSSKTNGSVTGSISGEYSRTAVKTSTNIKGAVSVSSSSPVTLLTAVTNESISDIGSFSSGDIVPTVSGASGAYYITKATTSISGGALTGDSTITCTSTGNFTCTPSVNFLSRSGSTTGSAITLSTYGITTTAPTSGSSVVFDPDGTLDAASRTVSASINVGRAAVTATISKGITKGATLTSDAVANTSFSGSKAVTASVAAGTSYYVPVVSIPKPSFGTASIGKPKVTMSQTVTKTGGSSTTVPTGVVTQASVPSGWTNYITITPNGGNITNGSVAITSTVTVGKGLTAGGTQSKDSTTTVGADTVVSNKTFIKIYDESYTIS